MEKISSSRWVPQTDEVHIVQLTSINQPGGQDQTHPEKGAKRRGIILKTAQRII